MIAAHPCSMQSIEYRVGRVMTKPHPLALIILDGWGYREETDNNAIAHAHKPNWDKLWETCPHTLVSGCGRCVGLPDDQMGNSEVGHLNMGAGRIVHQDLTRIDMEIENGDFFKNPVLTHAVTQAIQNKKAIHILGLISPGGVHSHERQIQAMIELASRHQAKEVYIHAFLDGRDTPPQSAHKSLELISDYCIKLQCGQIASLIGRYYAMDRDNRWERVQKAYDLLTLGKADFKAPNLMTGLNRAYKRGETDEFVQPTVIIAPHQPPATIQDGDSVIFMNFRADRARELTRAFVDPEFTGFTRTSWPTLGEFVSLTEYDVTLNTTVAYTPEKLNQILGEYLSQLGLSQLRIAETEKYAHVTFFFNGGIEKPYPGEDRILIPSPKVIICNFANPDMLGHTGNFAAAVKAIEVIDTCIGKIIHALKQVGGEALITADHGNAEMMFDEKTGQAHTAHTHELVPLVYVGRNANVIKTNGILADIAPTMLYLLGIEQPKEMTGQSIFKLT
jgi:2,3-bisphosphoglycerate-independent phosphoglycerate mutase